MKCENCPKNHNGSYGSGRFCSLKCSRSFSTKAKRQEINKNVSLKLKKSYFCVSCNDLVKGRKNDYCEYCLPLSKYKQLYFKMGLKETNLKKSNDLALDILIKNYFNFNMSAKEIALKYNSNKDTVRKFLLKNNINLRSLSDSVKNSIINGKVDLNKFKNNQFKSGQHKTWDNKIIIYRSSYELEYAKQLDEQRIKYDVESLRIKYWDSQQNKKRIAIPDFYLPESNTIVEIKSTYTLDKINMKDKLKAYKKKGYNFKLMVNKVEYKLK